MGRVILCLGLLCSLCFIGGSTTDAAEVSGPLSKNREIRTSSQGRIFGGVLTIYMWKMTEEVGLTVEQAAQVFPKIRETFRIRWQSAARRQRLLRLLEKEIDSLPQQEHTLKRLLAQWEENEAKRYAAQQEMRQALTRVLTPEQKAKSLFFEEQFQGDLTRVIREIRRERLQRSAERKRAKER